jgi:hypothetical protein
MAQITFRANLSAANVPYVSDYFARSIIIPQFDQNYQRTPGFAGADLDRDLGIPQVFYIENVLPTGQGFMSVGYEQRIAALTGTNDFDQIFLLRDPAENKFLFSPAGGKSYIYRADTGKWRAYNTIPTPGQFSGLVTRAYIHGRTFICYEKTALLEYDRVADTFNAAPGLTFLVAAAIRGICQAVNYTIAFDDTTIYWANPLFGFELDFTPSTLTGAGSSQIQEVRGKIIAVLPISGGFMVYTTGNVVKAQYSGNIRFPWVFSEVNGSAGIQNPEHVAYESNFSYHYAWTTAGLMKIDKTGTELPFPEASDFLAGKVFESYDAVLKTLTTQYLTRSLNIKVSLVANRYVVVSYGVTLGSFTHALLFDLGLKRWGKLKIAHVDAFEFIPPNFFGTRSYDQLLGNQYDQLSPTTYTQLSQQQTTTSIPGKNIGFLQQDGTIVTVNMEVGNINSSGVLFLGKFQLQRTKLLQLAEVEVENVLAAATNFVLTVLTSLDGKTFDIKTIANLIAARALTRKYGVKVEGENHTLLFTGCFNLNSTMLTVIPGGSR